jgi:anti-sigma factor RsiW
MTDTQGHVEDRLISLAGGELDASERRQIEAHLAGCAACRSAQADFQRIAAELARPAAPAVHWGAYRAELRDKLDARRSGGTQRAWWSRSLRPVSMAMAAGLVAVMLWIGGPTGSPLLGNGDLAADDSILASRLGLISRLDLVQQLDLLEDLDVIGRLDSGARDG